MAVIAYILFIRKVVTRPIGKLAEFTRGVASSGQLKTQGIELRTGDEIEELGKAFNFMLVELDHYISDLTTLTAEKERISAELNVATHIQSSMLPCIFPAFPERSEFDIYATMNPAKEVGATSTISLWWTSATWPLSWPMCPARGCRRRCLWLSARR